MALVFSDIPKLELRTLFTNFIFDNIVVEGAFDFSRLGHSILQEQETDQTIPQVTSSVSHMTAHAHTAWRKSRQPTHPVTLAKQTPFSFARRRAAK